MESWWTSSKEFGNTIPFATEATNSFEMNIPTISERKLGMTQLVATAATGAVYDEPFQSRSDRCAVLFHRAIVAVLLWAYVPRGPRRLGKGGS